MKRIITIAIAILALAASSFATTRTSETTFESIMKHYESIRVSLLNDTTNEVSKHAKEIARLADAATRSFDAATVGVESSEGGECTALLPEISGQARALASASGLDSSRDAFYELSKSLVRLKAMSSGDDQPTTYYCPMAKRSWLQKADEIGNPYFGQKMANCGQKVGN